MCQLTMRYGPVGPSANFTLTVSGMLAQTFFFFLQICLLFPTVACMLFQIAVSRIKDSLKQVVIFSDSLFLWFDH